MNHSQKVRELRKPRSSRRFQKNRSYEIEKAWVILRRDRPLRDSFIVPSKRFPNRFILFLGISKHGRHWPSRGLSRRGGIPDPNR
jgi:hypothetical protein